MIKRALLWSGCLSLCTVGCGSLFPQVVPEASGPFAPTGSVQRFGSTAKFDAVRVKGPNVDIAKRTDGSWGGRLQGWKVEATVTPRRLSGVEVQDMLGSSRSDFTMFDSGDGQSMVVDGTLDKYTFHWELHPDRLVLGKSARAMVLMKNADGSYGPPPSIVLGGDAAGIRPPWPQIAFAMLGTEQIRRIFRFNPHAPADDDAPQASETPPAPAVAPEPGAPVQL